MKLFHRLQLYPGTLPDPGGVLDQDERTMRILDIIASEFEEGRARHERNRSAEAKARSAIHNRDRVTWRHL